MGEEALDRHLEATRVVVGQVFAEIGGQVQLSFLDQEHRGGGGELLGDRTDAIHRVRRRRHLVLKVRIAESAGKDDLPVLLDSHGNAGGGMVPEGVLGEGVDPSGKFGVRFSVVRRGILGLRRTAGEQHGDDHQG